MRKQADNACSPIVLRFALPTGPPALSIAVSGFLHLWAIYVRGFDDRFHCQRCLRGRLSARVKTYTTPVEEEIVLNEEVGFDSVYVCGVARGEISKRRVNNLHLPLEQTPGCSFDFDAYNGYTIHVSNARLLEIPELPDGWMGLPREFCRCCNFRFGVSRFRDLINSVYSDNV